MGRVVKNAFALKKIRRKIRRSIYPLLHIYIYFITRLTPTDYNNIFKDNDFSFFPLIIDFKQLTIICDLGIRSLAPFVQSLLESKSKVNE